MTEFVGMKLFKATELAKKQGKNVVVKENFVHQNFANPCLVVTNARENADTNTIEFVVCEIYGGGKNV